MQTTTTRTTSTHAAAAKQIRTQLKAHGIAGTVRARTASMMDAVDVHVVDLAPWQREAVETFVKQFRYGHFDGATDGYELSNRRHDIPQVKYAHVHADFSDTLKQRAWDYLRTYFQHMYDAPADVAAAGTYLCPHNGEYGSTLLRQVLNGSRGKFWTKPRKRFDHESGRCVALS